MIVQVAKKRFDRIPEIDEKITKFDGKSGFTQAFGLYKWSSKEWIFHC